ncbi:MAG: DUF3100 domain-containing protein [Pseudomonadota bacterium]
MTTPERSILLRPGLIVAAAVVVAIAELIGLRRLQFGTISVVLLPMIFAFLGGLLLNPNLLPLGRALLREHDDSAVASRAVAVAVMPIVALMSIGIGPQFGELADAGWALLLQELGNLGTMFIALPVAVLLFGLGREAIGATFSIGREGGLAFIYSRYGADSAEASGVMAMYVCGTFFGSAFFAVLAPFLAQLEWLDVRALAMACGTGSASMTAACTTALGEVVPAEAELIAALGAASTLMTGLTGLFVTLFLTIPLIERYYRFCARIRTQFARTPKAPSE